MFMQLFCPASLQKTCIMRIFFFFLLFPRIYPDHGVDRLLVFGIGRSLRSQILILFYVDIGKHLHLEGRFRSEYTR